MDSIMIIEYIVALTLGIYAAAAIIVWVFELKKNALYAEMQRQVKFLESLHLSCALKHIKLYKVKEDYRRANESLERIQRPIFENVLLLSRQDGRKEKGFHA